MARARLQTAEASGPPAQLTRCVCLLACARSMLGEREGPPSTPGAARSCWRASRRRPGGPGCSVRHAYLAVARVRLDAGEDARAEAIAAPILAAAERSGWGRTLAGARLIDRSG